MDTAYSRNVYIASLPPTYTNEQLYALFSPFGHILSHSVKTDRVTGKCKGYGFVLFSREEDACNAVLGLQSHYVNHTKVQVRLARAEASAKRVYPVVAQQQELQSAVLLQQQQLAWMQYYTQLQALSHYLAAPEQPQSQSQCQSMPQTVLQESTSLFPTVDELSLRKMTATEALFCSSYSSEGMTSSATSVTGRISPVKAEA